MIIKKHKSLDMLFDEFILEKRCLSLSDATIYFYDECFKRFKSETNCSKPSENDIYNWIKIMKEKDISISSINHYLRGIRAFLYWCMKNTNEVSEFKISLLRCQETKIKTVYDDDIEILLKKPSKNCTFCTYRNYVIVSFIMATGARAMTICKLRIEDIDFRNREVTFRHLKNKELAILPLSQSLSAILKTYLNTWDLNTDYLFPDKYGNLLTTTALSHSIKKYCSSRGTKPYGPHSFRHSFARNWIKNGGSCFALQKLLTHSDLTMTKRYVRLFGDDLKKGFEIYSPLDALIKCEKKTIKRRVE